MSGILLILGQRLASRWVKHCSISYLYKNVAKDFPSIAPYCTSVKNQHLSKMKDFKHENETDTNNLHENIILNEVTKQSDAKQNKTKKKDDKYVSYRINKESHIQKKVERLYSSPKSSLVNIYTIVGNQFKDQEVLTSSFKQEIVNESQLWEATFEVKWPEAISFNGIGKTKAIASKNAALKCLQWLEINGKLLNGKPIIYDEMTIKKIIKPIELNVTPEILNKMTDLIETYDTKIQGIIAMKNPFNTYNIVKHTKFAHPVVKIPVDETIYTDVQARNIELKDRLLKRDINDSRKLPIFKFKDEILSKLQNNQVLLIEGDTGCGKTTQVPQFIMDSFTWDNDATNCNILVSQPRRISAISLANRIAHERNERVGDVVGFHVRLEQVLPQKLGGILFCTTGILLKKLQSNPSLLGCSHVILDEAHERHIDTDILIVLLKRVLKQNPDLKVVIMSATINSHLFQQYFDCPTVKVPGRLYPVEMNFLEDIECLPNIQKYEYCIHSYQDNKSEKLSVDYAKIVQIIKWISHHKPPGAILCFLPGWYDITRVQSLLEDSPLDSEDQLILPIHSKVSHDEQRKIFGCTPESTRKIILATDIAETGITVNDVIYVVDSAIRKESRWDYIKNLPCISNCWVSQANIHQRKGRAGRVKPGESYHLITKAEYEKLQLYPLSQILCNPLEKVILYSKTYVDEKAENFLGDLLEPPSKIAIQKSVNYLIELGVLDNEENLTALGKRIALFSMHPSLSKALVYSSIFNCIHPVVTIASIFSGEDNLFHGLLDNKLEIRKNKRLFHPSSDHIAMSWIFKQWHLHNIHNPNLVPSFCEKMKLRQNRMEILNQIRKTVIQELIESCMLTNSTIFDYNDMNIESNKYESNDELIRALLYSATQQLIEHKDIGFKNGVVRTGVNKLRTQSGAIAVISAESVNYKRKVWPDSYMTYLNSAHCEIRRSTVIRETSIISPLTVLLFNQGTVQRYKKGDGREEILINFNKRYKLKTFRFSCDNNTADVVLAFRDIMWSLVQYSLEKQGVFEQNGLESDSEQIFQFKDKLLETLSETLHESSKSIKVAEDETSHDSATVA